MQRLMHNIYEINLMFLVDLVFFLLGGVAQCYCTGSLDTDPGLGLFPDEVDLSHSLFTPWSVFPSMGDILHVDLYVHARLSKG